MSGPARSFLTNSGTEAVEAGIKLARWATGRQYLIAFYGSFHGRSYGSVSLTASKATYRAGFGPLLPGVLHAYYGDGRDMQMAPGSAEDGFPTIDYIEHFLFKRIVARRTRWRRSSWSRCWARAATSCRPTAGSWRCASSATATASSWSATRSSRGMGRTGKMWAVEHTGVEPDILLAGKGIASGMPLGAMIAKDEKMTWTVGTHGSTYGGNPVSCAAALATIDVIQEEQLLENADKVGDVLLDGLRDMQTRHDSIREVRGLALMIGVELPDHDAPAAVEQASFQQGPADAGVRRRRRSGCRPRSNFREDQARTALEIFEDA